jgi:hypothetical protein
MVKGVRVLIRVVFAVISAQFLGQMSPASVLDQGTGKLGGYFFTADDAFGVVASGRYGFSKYTEGRARLGFIDQDGSNTDPHIIFGIDAKYLLWEYIKKKPVDSSSTAAEYYNPFDLSLGFGLEYAKLESYTVFGLGGSVIGSFPFHFKNNTSIEPYARLNLRYQLNSYNISDASESNFEIGLNLGALFSVTPLVDITAEFQLDDQNAFFAGVDFAAF